MGRMSSVPPALNFSSLISKGNALCCVAIAGFEGRAGPLGFPCRDTQGLVPMAFRAAVPNRGALAASAYGETEDAFGEGR